MCYRMRIDLVEALKADRNEIRQHVKSMALDFLSREYMFDGIFHTYFIKAYKLLITDDIKEFYTWQFFLDPEEMSQITPEFLEETLGYDFFDFRTDSS